MRRLSPRQVLPAFAIAAVWLALPGAASAAVAVTGFGVSGSTTQAGGHPNLTISTSFAANPASDDVRTTTVRLPPGLVGNPNVTPKCSTARFAGDTCPGSTAIGSVSVQAQATLGLITTQTTAPGTVYNLPPVGSEPARLGIKVRPPSPLPGVTVSKISLVGIAKLGPDTGYALETTFPDQPREVQTSAGTAQLSVQRLDLTLLGRPGGSPFTINPSSCTRGTARATAVSYGGQTSTRTTTYTATGCSKLPFAPKASGSIGAKGANRRGSLIPLTTAFDFPDGNASLKDSVVTLPLDVAPNLDALARACGATTPVAQCPAAATIGNAKAFSPLLATPLAGPVILKKSSSKPTPKLVVQLKGAAPLTLEGQSDIVANRLQNTFDPAPDVPLSRFELTIDGGKGGLLQAPKDLCRRGARTIATFALTGWNGKKVTLNQPLKPAGCAGYQPPRPRAALSLRKGVLRVRVSAGLYTKVRSIRAVLPKGVTVSKSRLKGRAAKALKSRSLKLKGRALRVAVPGKGAGTIRLSAKRVRVSKRLAGRKVTLKLAVRDDYGRTVKLAVKARVRR